MPHYFDKEQEKIVQQYLQSGDELVFQYEVYPLLKKIAYGVCKGKRFKPATLFQSDSVINGCVSHLWECLRYKYDPSMGTKIFSYLTRCAFTYFCGVSRGYQRTNRTFAFVNREITYMWDNTHNKMNPNTLRESCEFSKFYYVDLPDALTKTQQEIKHKKPSSPKSAIVGEIKNQMATVRTADYCDKYINKKYIYKCIRKSTGATTKQIRATILSNVMPTYKQSRKNL